jgi:RimJ/RimL family protein N-acetyltransferase
MIRLSTKEDMVKVCAGRIPLPVFYVMLNANIAFTVCHGNTALGIAAVNDIFPGVAELWFVMDDSLRNYPKLLHSSGKEVIRWLDNACSYHRIQATCLADDKRDVRWLLRLGFVCEGVMRKYGPDGRDYFRFARVR